MYEIHIIRVIKNKMKSLLKKLLPFFIISWYHKILAIFAMWLYDNPSGKLIVIGVTGTNGKSTVVNLIGRLLEEAGSPRFGEAGSPRFGEAGSPQEAEGEAGSPRFGEAGYKIGWTSTANFKIADKEWLNDKKMTMLGRFQTQKFLNQMVAANCKYAIIETSSEGIKQSRHLGINYDIAVFTNLTPEHLEAHGGFQNYKKAKGELFRHLTNRPHKIINGQNIDKVIIANADDEHVEYFLNFSVDKKISFSINKTSNIQATDIQLNKDGSVFSLKAKNKEPLNKLGAYRQKTSITTNLIGLVNVYNCLAAIAVAQSQNIPDETIQKALTEFKNMPGRFEWIETNKNFKVMVDYAPEPESMKCLYETLKIFNFKNIIHVLGSTGGGRDTARRPILGKLAAQNANYVIVTNEDPYDDNPMEIIDNVAQGALEAGKILNENLFKIEDRREAIKKALSLAKDEDLVLLTGKGCEQYICIAQGKKIPWDDRRVARELIANN